MSAASRPLIIDAMQVNKPERVRFEEWRKGGLGCVHVTVAIWESARETLSVLGQWNRLLEENADLIEVATSGADIERIAKSGRTAIIFGFQDTSPFEDDLELVQIFHKLGVRIAQLTYNVQNRVACGCWEERDAGVSPFFGKNVIQEMNRLGMVVDISHCNERSGFDAVEYSSRPIAITHANPSEFVGTNIELKRRNKSTEQIKLVARRGGIIGLSMYPKILRDGSDCTIETFMDMLSWTVDLVGADHVGIGSDYYTGWPESQIKWWRAGRWARESAIPIKGFSRWPSWFQSSVDFPKLIEAIGKRGFSAEETAKIAGGNWLRFFNEGFRPAKG